MKYVHVICLNKRNLSVFTYTTVTANEGYKVLSCSLWGHLSGRWLKKFKTHYNSWADHSHYRCFTWRAVEKFIDKPPLHYEIILFSTTCKWKRLQHYWNTSINSKLVKEFVHIELAMSGMPLLLLASTGNWWAALSEATVRLHYSMAVNYKSPSNWAWMAAMGHNGPYMEITVYCQTVQNRLRPLTSS